jgi:azurin
MHVVAQNLPGLKPPAVWLPHTILGISNSGMIEDLSGGKFGPFAGQFYVGDQGQSKLIRVSLEKVAGVWQGAAYSFREGFESGILRMAIGENATMFVGESARGWGSVGPKQYGIERVTWTGQTPFEIKEIKAQPDGFLLTFTQPVDRATAENLASYSLAGFTYNYHTAYGAAPVNRMVCPIQKIVVAPDGLSVRLAAQCLREGYIHEVKVSGVRAATGGSAVLHPVAYYTLNRLPAGDRIIPLVPNAAELCVAALPAAASAHSAKHPVKPPTDWPNSEGDQAFLLGTQPGLKFDQTLLTTKAGTRIRLIFRNTDDMLHNFVLCAPGKGQDVGNAALALGVEGTAKNYVPDSADVLFHTAITQPETSDTIYFIAPTMPGDYDFICSFPGHSAIMKGILRVTAK